jgi:hypothetical protein
MRELENLVVGDSNIDIEDIFMYSIMISLLRVSTSESMIPRPCF